MIEERYKPKEEEGFGTTLGGRKVDSPLLFIASTTYVERPHTPSIFFFNVFIPWNVIRIIRTKK